MSAEMEAGAARIDAVHFDGEQAGFNTPFVPGITVQGGRLVFFSGMTAAPVYHEHPHVSAVFDAVPLDIEGQVPLLFDHLDQALVAAGCRRSDVVSLTRFFTDVEQDQDEVNRVQKEWFGGHTPTSTSVQVVRLATDPRLRLEIAAVAVAPAG